MLLVGWLLRLLGHGAPGGLDGWARAAQGRRKTGDRRRPWALARGTFRPLPAPSRVCKCVCVCVCMCVRVVCVFVKAVRPILAPLSAPCISYLTPPSCCPWDVPLRTDVPNPIEQVHILGILHMCVLGGMDCLGSFSSVPPSLLPVCVSAGKLYPVTLFGTTSQCTAV
jgi:hypothetical protein